MECETAPLTEAALRQVLAHSECSLEGIGEIGDEAVRLIMAAPAAWRSVMLADGEPVGAFGLVPAWPGRASAWIVAADHIGDDARLAAIEAARLMLDEVQASEPKLLHRVEMHVAADAPWRHTIADRLGLKDEGLLRCWGPEGADYAVYARVGEEV